LGSHLLSLESSTLPPGAMQTAGLDPTSIDVAAGGTATDSNGFQITGKVKGVIFEDTNGNGIQDPGEPGIEGVGIVITNSKAAMQTVTTDATGMYMAEVPVGLAITDIDESTDNRDDRQTAASIL